MIVAADGDRLRFVTQPDHARFAGELLALWRADGLPGHPRREEILCAAREHDNGWREADAAPRVDAESGRPLDFLSFPESERLRVWSLGSARFAGERRYAALLITRHARALLSGGGAPEDAGAERQSLLAELAERERELLAATGADWAAVAADYRFLDLADRLSLAACADWREPFTRAGLRVTPRAGALDLLPFPLAGATTFRVPCRWLPRRSFRGDADLGGALAAAPWQELAVRVGPG